MFFTSPFATLGGHCIHSALSLRRKPSEVEVSTSASMALLIDANRAGIRLTEAVRQLVWRCVQASE